MVWQGKLLFTADRQEVIALERIVIKVSIVASYSYISLFRLPRFAIEPASREATVKGIDLHLFMLYLLLRRRRLEESRRW